MNDVPCHGYHSICVAFIFFSQAIQTHRAAIAVLRHQAVFVAQLTELGMVDEREQEKLLSPIERRMWWVMKLKKQLWLS